MSGFNEDNNNRQGRRRSRAATPRARPHTRTRPNSEKYEIIRHVKELKLSQASVSKRFNVPESTLRGWLVKYEDLRRESLQRQMEAPNNPGIARDPPQSLSSSDEYSSASTNYSLPSTSENSMRFNDIIEQSVPVLAATSTTIGTTATATVSQAAIHNMPPTHVNINNMVIADRGSVANFHPQRSNNNGFTNSRPQYPKQNIACNSTDGFSTANQYLESAKAVQQNSAPANTAANLTHEQLQRMFCSGLQYQSLLGNAPLSQHMMWSQYLQAVQMYLCSLQRVNQPKTTLPATVTSQNCANGPNVNQQSTLAGQMLLQNQKIQQSVDRKPFVANSVSQYQQVTMTTNSCIQTVPPNSTTAISTIKPECRSTVLTATTKQQAVQQPVQTVPTIEVPVVQTQVKSTQYWETIKQNLLTGVSPPPVSQTSNDTDQQPTPSPIRIIETPSPVLQNDDNLQPLDLSPERKQTDGENLMVKPPRKTFRPNAATTSPPLATIRGSARMQKKRKLDEVLRRLAAGNSRQEINGRPSSTMTDEEGLRHGRKFVEWLHTSSAAIRFTVEQRTAFNTMLLHLQNAIKMTGDH